MIRTRLHLQGDPHVFLMSVRVNIMPLSVGHVQPDFPCRGRPSIHEGQDAGSAQSCTLVLVKAHCLHTACMLPAYCVECAFAQRRRREQQLGEQCTGKKG